jgi:hypothetical protein
MATKTPLHPAPANRPAPVGLRESLYRYWFYGWLFRDASAGSWLERAGALRHNREQAKWLPVYLLRWSVLGAILVGIETQAGVLNGVPVVSALLALTLVFTAMYLLMTTIFWAFLRGRRAGR